VKLKGKYPGCLLYSHPVWHNRVEIQSGEYTGKGAKSQLQL
jgi:hypothetical protein